MSISAAQARWGAPWSSLGGDCIDEMRVPDRRHSMDSGALDIGAMSSRRV
jgi:hypothetical protein